MLLDIFFNETYPYTSSLIKRKMFSLSLVKKFVKYKFKKTSSNIPRIFEKEKKEINFFLIKKNLN